MRLYYSDDAVELYHGDCLETLAAILSDATVKIDALVMDPPYASGTRHEAAKPSSGAMVRGSKWNAKPIENDQMTTAGFVWLMREVLLSVRDAMPDGASALSFIDWRQWPNLVGAMESANLRVQGMVVWDKESFGLGNGFRVQHELVCHASKGTPRVHDRAIANVIRCRRDKDTAHPSPKPVGLMAMLLSVVSAPGEIVLDPFCGAGATLAAAKELGRKAIGIEVDEAHCETAAQRLSQTALPLCERVEMTQEPLL